MTKNKKGKTHSQTQKEKERKGKKTTEEHKNRPLEDGLLLSRHIQTPAVHVCARAEWPALHTDENPRKRQPYLQGFPSGRTLGRSRRGRWN
jgi:hypothetical protein